MNKPIQGEIASSYDAGIALFTGGLIANPDPIVRAKGGRIEMYDELLRDDQVGPCFEQRRRAVTHCEIQVDPGGTSAADKAAAADLQEQLQNIDFDGITDRMLYALLHGYSVGEAIWGQDGKRVILEDIKVRDRARFRFDAERRLRLLRAGSPDGVLMPERKFWVLSMGADTSDNPYGRGLGHALYWPVFFKRNAVKFWMIYLDKFAQPTALGKYQRSREGDVEHINEILQMLGAIQTDSAVALPEDVTVELIEATRSGTADYNTIVDRMDRAIAKIILTQTMTTENGSSLAQAEVHKAVRDEVVKGDADLLCESFNRTIARWLTEWNHPGAKPPRVWRRTEPENDLNSRAERDQKIMTLGFEPTEEYITETYGPGWRRRTAQTAPPFPIGALPADFTEVSPLAAGRVAHRADQQQLADAAEALATQYPALIGKRVEQLLGFLEETDDVETFKARLAELMAEPPQAEAVQTIRNATFVSRLMGRLRGQR